MHKRSVIFVSIAAAVMLLAVLFGACLTVSAEETAPAVLHYYTFDGDAQDKAGGVDGTLSQNDADGGAEGLPQYSAEVRSGASGQSVSFSGSNFVAFEENIFSVEGDFTVSFWMNSEVPADSGTGRIISTGVWGADTPGILVGVNNNSGGWGNLVNGVGKADGEGIFNWSTALPDTVNGAWRHIVAVFNVSEGYYKVFIDGRELQYQPLAGGYSPVSYWGETALGGQLDLNSGTVSEAYTGYIDDLIVLKGALVKQESDTDMLQKLASCDIEYDITFESGEGSAVPAASVYWGNALPELPEPTLADMNFAGWSLTENGSQFIDESTKFYGDTTLYAVYSAATVTVRFVTGCDETVPEQTVPFNTAVTEPTLAERDNYTLAGWYLDEAFTIPFDFTELVRTDIVLYAKWNQDVLTVQFETGGGTAIPDASVPYGATVAAPSEPVLADRVFGGWFTDEECTQAFSFDTPVLTDMTLYAKWFRSEYTVRFETNGGTAIAPVTVAYNGTLTLPQTPVKEGYSFVNWYTAEDFSEIYIAAPVTDDLVLYAKWAADEYVIRFESNGGGRVAEQTVSYGESAKAPKAPVKEGYVFGGWFKDEALTQAYDFASPVQSGMTLYAKWTAEEQPSSWQWWYTLCIVAGALVVAGGVAAAVVIGKKKHEK